MITSTIESMSLNIPLADLSKTIKNLYSTYKKEMQYLYLSSLVNIIISISSNTLNISFEDKMIMEYHSNFVIEQESLLMLQKSTMMKIKKIEVDTCKLKFYEEKYREAFLITNSILEDQEQRKIALNEDNIKKTFYKLYEK